MPSPSRPSRRRFHLLAASLVAAPLVARSQATWPRGPVTLVVPSAPGSIADRVARLLAPPLAEAAKGRITVENRVAPDMAALARGTRDGSVLLFGDNEAMLIGAVRSRRPTFDPTRDFLPLATAGFVPEVLVVHPAFAAQGVAELVVAARAKPREIAFASPGVGSFEHLLAELLAGMTNTQLRHEPAADDAAAMEAVLAGRVPMRFVAVPSALPLLRAGTLRALGTTGTARARDLPQVPVLGETVLGYSGPRWLGLFAPGGTPGEVLLSLDDALVAAFQGADLRAKLEAEGLELAPLADGPVRGEEFRRFVFADLLKWERVARAAGAVRD